MFPVSISTWPALLRTMRSVRCTVTTADHQAYEAHIQTPHFRKYKDGTADMVRSLKLIDTMPLVMADFLKKAQ